MRLHRLPGHLLYSFAGTLDKNLFIDFLTML